MDKVTVRAVCERCDGTGLYQGFAEKDGCAVVCASCNGTGCTDVTYEPFLDRKLFHEGEIKRVFKDNCGYGHSATDVTTQEGRVILFSKGGCTYDEWLQGKEPLPVKGLYCPFQWTRQDLQINDVNNLYKTRCEEGLGYCGKQITECKHFADKADCWYIFEETTTLNGGMTAKERKEQWQQQKK